MICSRDRDCAQYPNETCEEYQNLQICSLLHTRAVVGLYRDYIGVIQGSCWGYIVVIYRGYIGITEKKETTYDLGVRKRSQLPRHFRPQ